MRFWNAAEANQGSLSEIIESGKPNRLNVLSRRSSAVPIASSVLQVGMRLMPLVVLRSRTTKIVSKPSSDVGKLVSKSIESCENGLAFSVAGIACSGPFQG